MGVTRRRQHVIIHKDARELFIRSEIDHRYEWLLKLLQQDFYEKVYMTDFEDTKDFDDDKRNFILNVFPKYKDPIAQQWFRSSDMKIEEDGHCELCGKEHTKYMYEIKNRLNDNVMIVGSSCIDNFGGINTKLPKGMTMEQFTNQQKRELEKLARLEEFSQKFGNVSDLIRDWNSEYEKLPFEVPYELHSSIINIHTKAKEIYDNYLKQSITKDAFEEFRNMILLRKKKMEEISKIIHENSKNRFACSKRIGNWLTQNGKEAVLNKIRKSGGVITPDVITEIYEENFISNFMSDFNRMLEGTRFSIRILNNKVLASFRDDNIGLKLNFYSYSSDFIKRFGVLLFKPSSKINEEEILSCLSLTDDDTNYSLIEQLNEIIKNTDYHVRLINDNYYLVKTKSKEYAKKLSIMKFIDIQKVKILLHGNKSSVDIINALNQVSSWNPISNIEKYDIGDISAKPNTR